LEILPLYKTVRGPLGSTWQFAVSDSPLTAGIDFSLFSEALFDKEEWTVSYAESADNIKESCQDASCHQ